MTRNSGFRLHMEEILILIMTIMLVFFLAIQYTGRKAAEDGRKQGRDDFLREIKDKVKNRKNAYVNGLYLVRAGNTERYTLYIGEKWREGK